MLLCLILFAELVTLSYVLHERVAVQLPVSRALTHASLTLVMALAAVAALRALGYAVDLVQVAVTVTVALLAALLFMGLGEQLNRAVELLLFPKQARLTGQLSASRAEAAALRSRLERAERLAIAGELAASVAHEIKNPLAAIRGYAELLAERLGPARPGAAAAVREGGPHHPRGERPHRRAGGGAAQPGAGAARRAERKPAGRLARLCWRRWRWPRESRTSPRSCRGWIRRCGWWATRTSCAGCCSTC